MKSMKNCLRNLSLPVFFALSATLVAIVSYAFLAFQNDCSKLIQALAWSGYVCPSKWEQFWKLELNAMGDTLAGFAGILVLIWVIAATFMQSNELRQARVEYKKMAGAMARQTATMKDQSTALIEEAKLRKEDRERRILDQLFANLVRMFSMTSLGLQIEFYANDSGAGSEWLVLPNVDGDSSLDDRVFAMSKELLKAQIWLQEPGRVERCCRKRSPEFFLKLIALTDQILERDQLLATEDSLRILSLQIPQMKNSLKTILELAIWERET